MPGKRNEDWTDRVVFDTEAEARAFESGLLYVGDIDVSVYATVKEKGKWAVYVFSEGAIDYEEN